MYRPICTVRNGSSSERSTPRSDTIPTPGSGTSWLVPTVNVSESCCSGVLTGGMPGPAMTPATGPGSSTVTSIRSPTRKSPSASRCCTYVVSPRRKSSEMPPRLGVSACSRSWPRYRSSSGRATIRRCDRGCGVFCATAFRGRPRAAHAARASSDKERMGLLRCSHESRSGLFVTRFVALEVVRVVAIAAAAHVVQDRTEDADGEVRQRLEFVLCHFPIAVARPQHEHHGARRGAEGEGVHAGGERRAIDDHRIVVGPQLSEQSRQGGRAHEDRRYLGARPRGQKGQRAVRGWLDGLRDGDLPHQ